MSDLFFREGSHLTGENQAVSFWHYRWKQACLFHPHPTPKTVSYGSKRNGGRDASSLVLGSSRHTDGKPRLVPNHERPSMSPSRSSGTEENLAKVWGDVEAELGDMGWGGGGDGLIRRWCSLFCQVLRL